MFWLIIFSCSLYRRRATKEKSHENVSNYLFNYLFIYLLQSMD